MFSYKTKKLFYKAVTKCKMDVLRRKKTLLIVTIFGKQLSQCHWIKQ